MDKEREKQSERKTDILNFIFAYFLGVITAYAGAIIYLLGMG